ncbi:MAG: T9SS type A sorting domain-containing protein [Bacteroidales bacterium]|nr:T9SS type A sorting domain-containing protein [Bacteroidales bacterium]
MRNIFILFLLLSTAISYSAMAQGDNCATAVQIITNGTYTANGPATGGGATNIDATNADWYYFTAPTAGVIDVSACNLSSIDTRLYIYDGSCATLNQLATSDDECTTYQFASFLNGIPVSAGTTYYIEWDDRWSQNGFDFTFNFTSYGTCPQPVSLLASNISQTTAILSWLEIGTATSWNIEYGPTSFSQGSGTMINQTTNNPYNLIGLSPASTYDFYVQSYCGPGDSSVWTGPYTFSTNCLSIMAPYSESFENTGQISTCWVNEPGDDFNWSFAQNTPSTGTGPDGDHTTGSGYFAFTEASYPNNPSMQADLLSPWIDISGLSAPALYFWYHMYGSSMGSLHLDINDGTSWTNDVWQLSGDQGNAWNDVLINLNSYSDSVQIRFRGITGDNAFSDMSIDDFSIDEMPTCPYPSNLASTLVQSTSAIIEWTEIGSALNWNIQYGPAGFALGAGTIVPTSNNPHTQNGLSPITNYDFYVQSDCGSGDTSQWIGPLSITTACAIYTAPYTEDFENGGAIPNCWTNDIGDDFNWSFAQNTPSINTGPDADHTTGSGYFAYTEASTPNFPSLQADLLSPWIDLNTLSNPGVSFWYHMYGSDIGSLDLDVNDGSGWVNNYWQLAGEQGNFWAQIFIDLSSFGDTVQVRFRGITGSYAYGDIAIDDIVFDEMPSCIPPGALTITNLTNNSANLGWTEMGSATEWEIEYGPAGFALGTGTLISGVTNNPYPISGLTAETHYQFYIRSICGPADSSMWSGPKPFTTYIDPISNPSNCEINFSIPDADCIDIPIQVTNAVGNMLGNNVEVTDINIIIEHTGDMDLDISLESPNGVIVNLTSNNGGNGNDYGLIDGTCTQYTNFNMSGLDGLITAGTPPYIGSYIPEGDFTDWYDNSNPNGLWILHVCDDYATDTGAVQFVEIEFNLLLPPATILINEIDCDQSSDTLEFVEIYDGGIGNYPLDEYAIAFYDGSSDQIYYSVDLDGQITDSLGYFVLGNSSLTESDLNFPNGLLQNGADAVALYKDNAANLPAGTPVTTVNLEDAIVYGTNDPVDIQLLLLLNMGQPQINEDNLGDKNMHSCSRLPNGSGGQRNTATYEAAVPTPGACNNPIPEMVWDSVLTESFYNNGSIGNTLHIELQDAQFSILGTMIENTHYTIANVPPGLIAELNTTSDSTAELSLLGNAASHGDADDIFNLSVEFLDAAYLQYAYYVENDSKNDIHIDFFDNTPKTLVWDSNTFHESILNDGSIGDSIQLLLFADTFSIVGNLTETIHYSVANVPSGLSTQIAILTDSTAIIKLSGNAISHFDSDDISNMAITFLDLVFTGGSASSVAHYRDTALHVDFLDQLSDSTDILAYSFPQQTGPANIDPALHEVHIEVTNGTLLNALTATFTLSGGASATITGTPQQSGISVNNFTSAVIYNVLAENGIDNQDWTVYVSIGTRINEISNDFDMLVYPNPGSEYFIVEISAEANSDFSISIFNISGQLIHGEFFGNQSDILYRYDCSNLAKGVYYIKATASDRIQVKKVILQ